MNRQSTRARTAVQAVLLLALLALSAALPPVVPPAGAQVSRLAELRQIVALRDAQGQSPPAQVIETAVVYLKDFPQGAYRDEALLILSGAQDAAGQPAKALEALETLIREHQESPFREQAMVNSLPLLAGTPTPETAEKRVNELVAAYPNSVHRNPALLWLAGNRFAKNDHAGTLRTLEQVDRGGNMTDAQLTGYDRMQTVSLVKTGQPAWTPLNRYLQRKDSAANKAEVLALVGQLAREAGRHEEALRYYRQIVEDYPVPEHLDEALFWRADLFRITRLANAPPEVAAARRETGLGYYNAYLKSEGGTHRPEAHLGRAELHQATGDHAAALADYDRALELNPALGDTPQVIRSRVGLYRALKRPDEAMALLTLAKNNTALTPADRTGFRIEEATLHYEARRCSEVEVLLNPMPIIPDPAARPRAFFMRGFCRYQQGLWEKATFDLEGLINDPQYQTLALNPLLDAYEKSGQSSRLVHLAEELIKAGRIEPDAQVFAKLAKGYENLGEPALMISAFQRMEKSDPQAVQTPEIQAQLGHAKQKLGLGKEAAGHYRTALGLMEDAGGTPPPLYLDTLERLQVLLTAAGAHEEIEALLAKAETVVTDPEGKARLQALKAGMGLSAGKEALARGEPQAAVTLLSAALAAYPAGAAQDPERAKTRLVTAALLIAAHLAADDPAQALAVFNAEAEPDAGAGNKAAPGTQPAAGKKADPGKSTEGSRPPDREQRLALAVVAALHDNLGTPGNGKTKEEGKPEPSQAGGSTASEAQEGGAEAVLSRSAKGPEAVAFHKRLLAALPDPATADRRFVARVLDRLYTAQGDFAARAALVQTLRKDGLDDQAKDDLRRYLSGIYQDWGRALLERKDEKGARFQLERGMALLKPNEWAERYAFITLLGSIYIARGEHTELVLVTEDILPRLQDEKLAASVRNYLGQVYLNWAQAAEQAQNDKSARIRYHRALDYLDAGEWQRRLAAANGVAKVLIAGNHAGDAAALLAGELPNVKDAGVAQQYALYLAKLYLNPLKQPEAARPWLGKADTGGNDPLSVEAAYMAAELDAERDPKGTLERLNKLTERKLGGTLWEVPVHYRLAVMHHQAKRMKEALHHYRIVGAAKNPDAQKTYPRAIKQSEAKAKEIESYLKSSGGGGSGITVPRVQ